MPEEEIEKFIKFTYGEIKLTEGERNVLRDYIKYKEATTEVNDFSSTNKKLKRYIKNRFQ